MRSAFYALFFVATLLSGQNAPLTGREQPSGAAQQYYWISTPVGSSAQLLTLVCKCCSLSDPGNDLPVVSLLRDTLGDTDRENDRIMYIWLLGHRRQTLGQRILAGIPFFYWRVGGGGTESRAKNVAPLMDLTTPAHHVLSQLNRSLLQWTLFDPMTMPVRASSRAYRANASDNERLHIEEAISYLERAPYEHGPDEPTASEIDTVIARLSLRKQLLGGLVHDREAEQLGQEQRFERERIRSRNWELLRECAEKTGLLFEPLRIGSQSEQFGMLWFPVNRAAPERGIAAASIWKLLNIRDPWSDDRLQHWGGAEFTRAVDENGALLPAGAAGSQQITLIPLGAYSLSYPKLPLLLVDFRDKLHLKRHELTQRTINQITSGVIGVSHFTNWYYYAGADLYSFVVARHGAAMDQPARLDCYSQFRLALALDGTLDPRLREEMQKRVDSLAVNPLESSPEAEVRSSAARYAQLQADAIDGRLMRQLNLSRRAEVAQFGRSAKARAADVMLHSVTLGAYTRRAQATSEMLAALDRERRTLSNLEFLDNAVRPGTEPEIAYDSAKLAASVNELSALLPGIRSRLVERHAAATLSRVRELTRDSSLQADCAFALASINRAEHGSGTGIAASSRASVLGYLAPVDKAK